MAGTSVRKKFSHEMWLQWNEHIVFISISIDVVFVLSIYNRCFLFELIEMVDVCDMYTVFKTSVALRGFPIIR